ncbi:FecR family protein [Sphingomonas alba]|uniref:FecR domain-containing protein n=1 Tax=Sphingomonas alba TaxID=2908208 RepID=A0ABT0RPB1_9SPHN|nr:FecR domain-containing protein [Sphingomonas alba]MCL6684491.1 FecR domain-containing protein [Sphingomonas alba]
MTEDRILDEASGWFVRQQDDAMDWEGFTAWLEADPRHRQAYDGLCALDSDLDFHGKDLEAGFSNISPPANDDGPRWGRWAGLGGAVAAALALVVVMQPVERGSQIQEYRSAVGHSREVALADGTRVALAPDSRLTVSGPQLALEGTAYFDVPHKPGRELAVRAGSFTISDVGTRFAVANEAGSVSVDVEDGRLSVSSDRLDRAIVLTAGHGIKADEQTIRLTQMRPADVASWRNGKLQFENAPLSLVVRDISRYSGRSVTADPAVSGQPFSGVIAIDNGDTAARNLAQIMALDARPVDGGVRLEPRRR